MASDKRSPLDHLYPHSPTALAIDFAKLPCYLCQYFPPYKRDVFRAPVLKSIQLFAARVRRPLTPDETKAWAYHGAKCLAIKEWTLPFGISSLITHYLFHGLKALRNPLRVAIHGLLPTACIFLSGIIVPVWGIARDPRLTNFYAELIMIQRGKSYSVLKKENRDLMEAIRAGSLLPDIDRTSHAGDKGMVRGDDVGEAKRGAQAKLQETGQQPVSSNSPGSIQSAAERQPVGLADRDHNPSSATESDWSQEPSDGDSASERIRRGARPSASGKNERRGTTDDGGTREQRENSGSSGGDDFSFSSLEQERSYAQEEAQRDFDARVKKERQGRDFSEKSGGGG